MKSKFDKKIGQDLQELRTAAVDGLFTAYTSELNWKLAHKNLNAYSSVGNDFAGEEIDLCDNFNFRYYCSVQF